MQSLCNDSLDTGRQVDFHITGPALELSDETVEFTARLINGDNSVTIPAMKGRGLTAMMEGWRAVL